MRLLVTAISGDVSVSILRSLADHGYQLYGCDIGQYPAGMDMVKDWARVPCAREGNYVSELLKVCRDWDIRAVLPVNEEELAVLDRNRQAFEAAGIRLIMNDSFILQSCLDKYACMRELAALAVQVPETAFPNDLPDGEHTYILKPRCGCGSKFIKTVNSAEEARKAEKEYGGALIAQEYLPDASEEYTMGVFSDGETTRCIIFRRRLSHGYTSFVELAHDKEMEAIAQKVASAWNLRGSINIQMRRKNGKVYVFEINPRLSGTTHFRALLGFNDAFWWCETACGRPLPAYQASYCEAIGLREMNEKFIIMNQIKTEKEGG